MPDSRFPEQSFARARWFLADPDLSVVEQVVRKHSVPEIIARLLVSRGVAIDDVPKFLNPTLKNDFPDPFSLAGMDGAAAYLAKAITDKRKIAIFADFDVDGATSSALLHRFLKHFGIDAPVYIPDRLTEGYGPNIDALRSLKDQGMEIVVLLDCGTTAFDTLAAAKEAGLEIVVIDHHEAEEKLPEANFVVNPKRKDDISGLQMLAACGVTFMVCVAVNNILKKTGAASAPLKEWLDLVALGTVCDMVPLTGVNRLFVKQGFAQMAARNNPGIKALLGVSKVNQEPTVYHAGFVLGPRINAGSRVHKSNLGAQLLATDDPQEANSIAWLLNDCNDKRKDLQAQMEEQAIDLAEKAGALQYPVLILGDPSWHPGLSGLVAGRLKDKYGKPVCIITTSETGEMRGSGRSVPGIHIAQAFIDARNAGLLDKGGGHAMAGGFTIKPGQVEAFRAFMYDHIGRQAKSAQSNILTVIDGVLSVRGIRADLVKLLLDNVGPFGQEQPEPLFLLSNVRIHTADVMGSSHIRAMVSDWEGGTRIKTVAFKAVGTPLGDAILKQGKRPFHLVGNLKLDTWNGRESPEFHIRDGAFALAEKVAEAV